MARRLGQYRWLCSALLLFVEFPRRGTYFDIDQIAEQRLTPQQPDQRLVRMPHPAHPRWRCGTQDELSVPESYRLNLGGEFIAGGLAPDLDDFRQLRHVLRHAEFAQRQRPDQTSNLSRTRVTHGDSVSPPATPAPFRRYTPCGMNKPQADDIARRLDTLHASITHAASQAGRKAAEVKLIAVSKTQPAGAVAAAVAAGQRVFGENTVQDALTKIPQFAGQGLEWHFIGGLQSNKVKFIPGNFSWVHSLDSLRLAERLSRMAQEKSVVVQALIEVNVTRDPAKHGVAPEAVEALLDQLLKTDLPGIALRGLMTIGPQSVEIPALRAAFSVLRELRDRCRERYSLDTFTELSMGMSGDYVEAILEGATMVRLGTAVFGGRSTTGAQSG